MIRAADATRRSVVFPRYFSTNGHEIKLNHTNRQEFIDKIDDSMYNAPMLGNGLDEFDHQLITALKENGRMPFAEIARRLDVSPGMVRERYHRLVEGGFLQVVAVTRPPALGYRMMSLIGIKVDGSRLQEIAKKIAAFDQVVYLVICAGSYDLLAEVICRDNAELLQFLTERLHTVDGVRDTETFVYLDITKEIYT
jgi:Lrp/AsnC family transcriptional regulator for asnA, asnC and gidA